MKKLLLCIAILATDSFSALCVENATIRFGASSDMSATTLTTPTPGLYLLRQGSHTTKILIQ